MIFRGDGFTLIEIIVAVAILALLGLSTAGVVQSTFMAKTAAERDMEVTDIGRAVLRKISRDIFLAFKRPRFENAGLQSKVFDVGDGPDARSSTEFVGRNGDPYDEIHFTTLSHRRYYRDSHESEQAEVSYFVEADPGNPDDMVLYRRESKRIDGEPFEGGKIHRLARFVTLLDFRFLDCAGEKYVEEWDSEESPDHRGKFPEAVEVALGLDDLKGGERIFQTTIVVRMPNNLKRRSPIAAGGIDASKLTLSQRESCDRCKKEKKPCPVYCPKENAGKGKGDGEKEKQKLLTESPVGVCSQ